MAGRSPLTKVLKQSFTDADSHCLVLATVSPAAKDTEHSLNTLRHACIMDGQPDGVKAVNAQTEGAGPAYTTGGRVVKEEVGEIDQKAVMMRRKAEAEQLQKKQYDSGAFGGGGPGGFGYGDRGDGGGFGDPQDRAKMEAKREEAAKRAAFNKLESKAWKALSQASVEQYAALKDARAAAVGGPSLNDVQMARMRFKLRMMRETMGHESSGASAAGEQLPASCLHNHRPSMPVSPTSATSAGSRSNNAGGGGGFNTATPFMGGISDADIDDVSATGCSRMVAKRALESIGPNVVAAIELIEEAQQQKRGGSTDPTTRGAAPRSPKPASPGRPGSGAGSCRGGFGRAASQRTTAQQSSTSSSSQPRLGSRVEPPPRRNNAAPAAGSSSSAQYMHGPSYDGYADAPTGSYYHDEDGDEQVTYYPPQQGGGPAPQPLDLEEQEEYEDEEEVLVQTQQQNPSSLPPKPPLVRNRPRYGRRSTPAKQPGDGVGTTRYDQAIDRATAAAASSAASTPASSSRPTSASTRQGAAPLARFVCLHRAAAPRVEFLQ